MTSFTTPYPSDGEVGWGPKYRANLTEIRDAVSNGALMFNVKDYGAVGDGSNNDSGAILECIAAAAAEGGWVYWPPGTYLVTSNLTSFWTVHHVGPGVISSGGSTFRITPGSADTNTIYLTAGTGNNANDGLSASRPIRTLGQVDVIFQNLGEKLLRGNWKIRMSGTFSGGYTFAKNLRTPNPIVFEGDALVAGQPVTTIDYLSGGSIFGLRFEPGAWVQLKNLKFTNFQIGYNGYGALVKGGGDMYVLNCRAENCDTGFAAVDQAVMGVYDSFVTGCTNGIRVQYGSTATVGASGLGTTIENCDTGFFVSRNAVAHLDYSTITDCTVSGVLVDMQSRLAMIDGTIWRNAVGVTILGAAEWTQDPDTDWGIGTANANTVNWRHRGAGHENRLHSQETHVEWRMYCSTAEVSTSAGSNTALIIPPSNYQFQPGHFNERAEQKLRAKIHGTLTGSGAKSLSLYKNDTVGSQQVMLGNVTSVTAAGEFTLEIEVWPTGNSSQMYAATLLVEGQTPVHVQGTTAATNDHIWLFRLYANSGNASSTVTVRMFELFITG